MLNVTYNSQKIIDSLEVTQPVEVTYNGSTIATLNAGDTKTLQCNRKVMAGDLVIGDKILQCNYKRMASDIVVDVRGRVTPTGETWVMNNYFEELFPATQIKFVSSGTEFVSINYSGNPDPPLSMGIEYYTSLFPNEQSILVWDGLMGGWIDNNYRTVTFLEPPTGDLLTWLQANAVKQ